MSDRLRLDPFNPGRTRVFQPLHVTRRIVAQSGWFTVHQFQRIGTGFVPLEKNKRYVNQLMSLRIPNSAFPVLRRELDRFGLNASVLFPDLTGLCATIQWNNFLGDDENE